MRGIEEKKHPEGEGEARRECRLSTSTIIQHHKFLEIEVLLASSSSSCLASSVLLSVSPWAVLDGGREPCWVMSLVNTGSSSWTVFSSPSRGGGAACSASVRVSSALESGAASSVAGVFCSRTIFRWSEYTRIVRTMDDDEPEQTTISEWRYNVEQGGKKRGHTS